ncbi:MAG: glycosyl hydrolase family 8 [Bacteroidales bacterium]|nr:glycosyl hydrolase family 8 [Bacteroidales bacterium]
MKRFSFLFVLLVVVYQAFSQSIATGYTVGTWSGFRSAAASFTFDDDAPSHVSVVAPEFDKRGFNATFNVVVNWMNQSSQWSDFQKMAAKGHEIASHTVTHSENTPSSELSSSKTTINQKITGQDCNTIAYPYCNVPSDASALAANYIGGRICDGQIMGKTPSDYFRISAITTGSETGFTKADDFTSSMQSAASKGGWVVFLTHGITGETNGNATYSPTPINAITGALDWAKENDSKIWVATFRDAILYAKERDALSLSEKKVSSTNYQLTASVGITSSVVTYDYPITVRREMPSGWKNFAASTGGKDISVKTVTVGSTKYAQFDVVPGKTYSLEDRESEYTEEGETVEVPKMKNLIENGEFDEGTSSWQTQTGDDAKCTLTATTTAGLSGANAVQLCPDGNYGTENWHIQVYQNVELEGDVEYTLSFSAKASTARKLYVMVQKIAADYDTYLYQECDLTTTAKDFEFTMVAPSDVAMDSKVTFCIGGSDGCVMLDKVFFGYENQSSSEGGGDRPSYDVEVSGGIEKYFVDKAYIGPSCDALPGEEVTNGAYYTGEYTNLFVKYLGKTEAQVQAKMKSVWDHFYTPNGQNTVYYEAGSDMAYIYDTGNQDVRTEGQSYGLMICVQMGDQEKFDKLWRWAKKYMQYKSGDAREGLFAWQCETNGTIKGASSAPDGEMYFLTALFFASHRWGNDGAINYEEEAQYLAKCLLNKSGRGNGQVSPLFNKSNYLVTFGETSYDFSDPSYNLPGFLELWARWINTNTDFWVKTPQAARDLLYNSAHKTTGLYPDYCNFDGSGYYPNWAGYNTSIYKYDAIRCPMNVGMDYHWFAADSRQETMMYNILNFFKKDGYSHAYFNVDGTGADGYYSEGQKGANGVGVFGLTAGNEALAKENLQKLWDVTPPTGQWRYYNGMVYMLSMLHATGNFRIFKPTPEVVVETLSGPAPVIFNEEEFTKDTTFKTLIDCKIYDVTITIEESAATYTVTFEDYDGTELKSEEVAAGDAATAPTEPTRTGYTFKEWDTDFSNVTKDLTVTAVYDINTYTVTFVDYDGSTIDEQTVEYGSDAFAPTEPTREGYEFDGWDKTFTNITKDVVVTATYTEKAVPSSLKYEAEDAIASGTTTASSSAASNGKYVKMQSGNLTFNVTVEKAGIYDVTIVYSLTEDYKAQNLEVNGVQVGTLAFNKSGSANPTFSSITAAAALNSGANTIAITNSWGWVDIDYIELSTHESVKFNIDANLVIENPTSGTVELYEFLKKNFGKKTISGVMTLDMPDNASFKQQPDVSYIYDKSGKYTALVGFDFMQSVGKGTDWATTYNKTMIAMAKELWNEGGIPYFTWHWRDPTKSTSSFNTSGVSFSLKDAFTDASCTKWNTNSTLYKGIIADLDVIANHLLDLQNAGVSVLWRPLHEASGKWFWWGAEGAEPYKQLYYLLFEKLTKEYDLHNLVWVWNSDGTDADWYPGDNYVDIAGRDFYYQAPNTYNHSSLVTEFEAVAKVVNGKKIVTLAECGAVPYPQNMDEDGAMWSWFMPWYDEGDIKYVSSDDHNKASDWDLIMNDDRVITLEDMPGWGSVLATTYTVTFVDYDGTVLDEQTVEEGEDAVAPEEPTRAGYTFKEWDTDFTKVSEDLTVTAVYVEKAKADYTALNKAIADAEALETTGFTAATVAALQNALTAAKAVDTDLLAKDQATVDAATKALTDAMAALAVQTFTVIFVDYDGTTIDEQTVEYGQSATKPATDPVRNGYVFSGWIGSYENVTADVTVQASYTEKGKADYTALNNAIAAAEKLETTSYTDATVAALQKALTAAKAVDTDLLAEDQATVDAATKALEDAMSALAVQTFTVTFVDYDGKVIDAQTVEYGASAVAPKEPSRNGYTFSAWEGSYEKVTEDVTITATYTAKEKADYTSLDKAISSAEALEAEKDKYADDTWKVLQSALAAAKAIDRNLYKDNQKKIDDAKDLLVSAISTLSVKSFTVKFTADEKIISEQIVEYGKDAEAPFNPTKEGYDFVKWVGSYTNVTEDLIITAEFSEKSKADYTQLDIAIKKAEAIEASQYDDESLQLLESVLSMADKIDRNLLAENQSVVDDAVESINEVLGSLKLKTFTVTFIVDGEIVAEKIVEYGETVTAPSVPVKKGYEFVGWKGDYSNVIKDVTVEAEFTIQMFTVTFVDYDGSEIKKQTVEYGQSAEKPANPSRSGFEFTGWIGSYENVTSNVTVMAGYTEIGKAVYTNLDNAIAKAKNLSEDKYTVETWKKLQSAIVEAESIDRNLEEENQSMVDVVADNLNDAIDSLVLKSFTVTFVVEGKEVDSQIVIYGEAAKLPTTTPEKEGYDFVQWIGNYSEITGDVEIVAEFKEKAKADYTALDAAIVKAESVDVSYYSEASLKKLQSVLTEVKAIDRNLYSDKQSVVNTALISLKDALSNLALRTFEVTFIVDGEVVSKQDVEYGRSALAPATPVKNGYTFVRWSDSYSNITADIQIEAIFTEKVVVNLDRTLLNYTIEQANKAMEKAEGNVGNAAGQYPASAVLQFQAMIETALDVYENATKQVVVDNEVTILENAINVFLESVNPEIPDKTELALLIKQAGDILDTTSVGTKPGQYSLMENWNLTNVRMDASLIYDNPNAKKSEVDAQVELLRNSIEAYVNSVVKEETSAVETLLNEIVIYAKGHVVVVENADISDVQIYDITGQCVSRNGNNQISSNEIFIKNVGVYIVKVKSISQRVVIK